MAPSLVLLLPHGYEGQGPDHSSARLERFLNAAADTNMRIANCTTAAQYFHLLRRQAMLLKTDPLPLVVMTPKSLLRHPFTASAPAELAEGSFYPVIDDHDAAAQAAKVRRIAFCSGKVAVDLLTSDRRKDNPNVAVVRVEQLYPFPSDATRDIIERYPTARECAGCRKSLRTWGRGSSRGRCSSRSSTAGIRSATSAARGTRVHPKGSSSWHAANQRAIVDQVFEAKTETRELDRVLSKQV
jgi:2-oxoglutarate dehydrogenase E1 component